MVESSFKANIHPFKDVLTGYGQRAGQMGAGRSNSRRPSPRGDTQHDHLRSIVLGNGAFVQRLVARQLFANETQTLTQSVGRAIGERRTSP